MLEHYMFPWGNKRKLQKELAETKANLKSAKDRLHDEIRYAHHLAMEIHKLKEEEYQRQYKELMPIAEQAVDMGSLDVSFETLHHIDEEIFGIRYRMPPYRFRDKSAMDYTGRAIDHCAHELAHRLVESIAYKMREVYHKMKGE